MNTLKLKKKIPPFVCSIFFWGLDPHPSTSGTSTCGGVVMRKPASAWLEGTPAMEQRKNGKRGHM